MPHGFSSRPIAATMLDLLLQSYFFKPVNLDWIIGCSLPSSLSSDFTELSVDLCILNISQPSLFFMAPNRMPNSKSKRILWSILFLLRLVLAASVVVYAVVEILKFSSNKEILHLAMFSMFFLVANFQVGVGKHKAIISDEEAGSLFVLTLFSLSAALFELVDLALDQVLKELNPSTMPGLVFGLNVVESVLGFCAVLLLYYSMDRFLVFLRSVSFKGNPYL